MELTEGGSMWIRPAEIDCLYDVPNDGYTPRKTRVEIARFGGSVLVRPTADDIAALISEVD
jgi:hypothetical protein